VTSNLDWLLVKNLRVPMEGFERSSECKGVGPDGVFRVFRDLGVSRCPRRFAG
jgi:hypothetical protein